MSVPILWLIVFGAIGISVVLILFVAVHGLMNRICIRHIRTFCGRSGLEIRRVRFQPAFDRSGVKTESTIVQVDCSDAHDRRKLIEILVWPFGVRKIIRNEEYPDSYDQQWPQAERASVLSEDKCRDLYIRGIKLRKQRLRVTDEDILSAVSEAGYTSAEVGEFSAALLRDHPENLKGESIEALVSLMRICNKPSDYGPILASVLLCTNHQWSENLAAALQWEKDARTVDALCQTALTIHDHLHYDEFFNVARKCTWALADIGTPEARAKLQLLSKNENPVIAKYAQKRLDGWEREMPRKGTTPKS